MPRDSNGNYTLPLPDVVGGGVIDAGDFNTTMGDIATAVQDSLSRSGKGGMQVPFEFADGTVGAPAITWVNETNAGFYRISAGEFGYSVGGSKVLNINASGIDGVIGATTPAAGSFTSISFDDVGSNWTNAGRTIADLGAVTTADINGGTLDGVAIGATTPAVATVTTFTSNGIDDNATSTQLTITDTSSTFGGNVTIPVGSAGSPSLNFSGDTDTGLYRIGANNLGIATGGTLRVNVDSVGKLTYTNNIAGNDGSEGIPSYVFASDNDTGMYKVSANTLGFSTGGTKRLELDSVGKATFSGSIDASAGGIYLGGSAASNLLDYYEEDGTFTPIYLADSGSGTITYATQAGFYTKVGNVVKFSLVITASSLASRTGGMRVGGLPFLTKSGLNQSVVIGRARGLSITAGYVIAGRTGSNSDEIDLFLWDSSIGVTDLQAAELTDDGSLNISGTYLTN